MKTVSLKTAFFGLVGAGLITLTTLYLVTDKDEPNLIVISKDLVAKNGDLSTWLNDNHNYCHTDQEDAGTYCADNIVIDLDKISKTDGKLVRKWLKDNTENICFEDAYKFIEKAHLIDDVDFKLNINNATERKELTYDSIRKIIEKEIKKVYPDSDFEKQGYQGYMNFQSLFDTDSRIIYDQGDIDEGRYSIPFFRSIKYKINEKLKLPVDDSEIVFTFVKAKDIANKDVIAFIVKASNGNASFEEYYNFSTDPGKSSTYKIL